jgi:hypothetical protein
VTTEAQSAELLGLARQVVDVMAALDVRLVPGESSFLPHTEHASRARDVGMYLDAALELVERTMLPQAFAMLRSALECWALDATILVGDRYVQETGIVTREAADDLVARWRDGNYADIPDEPEVVDARNGAVRVRLVRQGLRSNDDNPTILHPLYFEVRNYDPFFGNPDEQDDYADSGLFSPSHDLAIHHRQLHNTWLRWSSLVQSLLVNDLVPERHIPHLRVHYRYLSAFTHGHRAALDAATGVAGRSRGLTRHVVHELAVGYVCVIGARYLDAFLAMADRPPAVGIDRRDDLGDLVARATRATHHLWFLTDTPQAYDLGQELVGRAGEAGTFVRIDPASVAENEIRYYRDPLKRLLGMHESTTELSTGFSYMSPYR